MKFIFNTKERKLLIIAKDNENALVSTAGELCVAEKTFDDDKDFYSFVEEYSFFVQHVLNDLIEDEEIKDVVAISKSKNSFIWRSLSNHDNTGSSNNMFDVLLDYGLSNFDELQEGKRQLAIRDKAKLNLAILLIKSIKTNRNKKPDVDKIFNPKIEKLKEKMKVYENKYGFSSDLMYKYHKDDEMPDKEFVKWLSLYDKFLMFSQMKVEFKEVEKITDSWMKVFEQTQL